MNNVFRFEDFLCTQGIYINKATEEEKEIIKVTFAYAYRIFCNINNFEMEEGFEL